MGPGAGPMAQVQQKLLEDYIQDLLKYQKTVSKRIQREDQSRTTIYPQNMLSQICYVMLLR